MASLQDFRSGKPQSYPDQAIYAEFACAAFGLGFAELDGGSGLLFSVASPQREICFGAGRCSFYPQNNATAASLAADKQFANRLMQRAGLPTLGGRAFFLHQRHRALRGDGHERDDAITYLGELGGSAFAKPLFGSRGDFAQPIDGTAALTRYLDEVAHYYDSVLLQPKVSGDEMRVFVIDGEVLYAARKRPPAVIGDGSHTLGELIAAQDDALLAQGVSAVALIAPAQAGRVLSVGARFELPGRMNRSAGGAMLMAEPAPAVRAIACGAVAALGLRLGAVDLFTDLDGAPGAIAVIEVNANPAIRFLEDSGRDDLILAIWRHSFLAMGLL